MGILNLFRRSDDERRSDIIGVGDVADSWLRGTGVGPDTALGIPAALRGINLISSTVARLPLPVYRRTETGRERQRSHPADRLLNLYADEATPAYQLRRAMTADAILHGGGFAQVIRDGAARPTALRYLPGGHVDCVSRDGRRWYEYHTPSGGTERLGLWDVIHVPGFPGPDGWAGVGFVEHANSALATIQATSDYTRQFYSNSGRPNVVVKLSGAGNKEAQQAVRNSWLRYWTPANSGKPVLTDSNTEIQELSTGESALSALEGLRNHDLISIANLLGLPPHLVGAKSTVYKSLEQENRNLVMFGLDPWLVGWEKAVALLYTEADRLGGKLYAEHTREALYQSSTADTARSLIEQVNAGLLTPNEARAAMNRPALEGGDAPRLPVNVSQIQAQDEADDETTTDDEENDDAN
jgi:HK97 family phage portal protein